MDGEAYSYNVSSTDREINEDSINYEEKKYNIIQYLKAVVGKERDGKKSKTVAIIGMEGAGKSSLINSVAAAFTNTNWRQYAFSAYFRDNSQVTMCIESFSKEKYCSDEELLDYCFPTLLDMAGFENKECNITEEILRLVFYGRIPDYDSLVGIREYAVRNGIPKLRERFVLENDGPKVDVVVFVASAYQLQEDGYVPDGLIKNVRRAARPSGASRSKGRRVIPIFGVMTKTDKVNVSDPSFVSKEQDFMHSLGLDRTRYLRCENYCDEVDDKYSFNRTDHVLAKLDVRMLTFLKMVCDPVIVVLNTEENYDTAVMSDLDSTEKAAIFVKKQQQSREREMKQFWFTNSGTIVNALKFVTVFILMYCITLVTSTINSSFSRELITVCAEHKYSNDYMPYLTKLCNYGDGYDLVFTYKYCFWYSVTVSAIVVGFDIFFPEICTRLIDHLQRLQQLNA